MNAIFYQLPSVFWQPIVEAVAPFRPESGKYTEGRLGYEHAIVSASLGHTYMHVYALSHSRDGDHTVFI